MSRSIPAGSAPAVHPRRWKGRTGSNIRRWDVIILGNLSRNRYRGESDAKVVRAAICTCTLVTGEGFGLLVDCVASDTPR